MSVLLLNRYANAVDSMILKGSLFLFLVWDISFGMGIHIVGERWLLFIFYCKRIRKTQVSNETKTS